MSTLEEYKEKFAPELMQALDEFQRVHAPRGFISTAENGQALILHLAQNNMPPTLASLEQSAEMHVGQGWKFYYTADEQALNAVRDQYDANTLAVFDAWWKFQHVQKDARSEAAVLSECRGHVVDRAFLDLALGRSASKGKIVFAKAPGQDNVIAGQYSGKDLRDTVDKVYDALGHLVYSKETSTRQPSIAAQQYAAKLQRDAESGRTSTDTDAYWKSKAEDYARANLASTRLELSRILVTKPGTSTPDWKATAEKRKAMQDTIG